MDTKEATGQKLFRRKKFILILCALLAVIIGATAPFIYSRFRPSPIPKSISSQVTFKLYFPADLPAGWQIDNSSFAVDASVVFYKLHSPKGDVVITTQARPANFDYSAFYKENLKDAVQFDTSEGHGAVGMSSERITVGSLASNDSWVLLSPNNASFTRNDMQTIVKSLESR